MKKFVEILPMLTTPIQGEGAELNYPGLEKLILALVHAARRLRSYFQAHTVTVLTNSPIRQTLTKPEKSGRVAKWAIKLGEHDIAFQKRGDETPNDFLIEVPPKDNIKETEGRPNTKSKKMEISCEWKLYTDGAASSDGSGAGLMLIDPEGKEYTYALRFGFETTNNEAEYEALLAGLRIAQDMKITSLANFIDSQLLVNQIKGTYAAKQPTIREYLQKTKEALKGFDSYTTEHIQRNQNKKANALSKLSSMTFEHLTKEVLVEVLSKRSIEEKEIIQFKTKEKESWMTPIHEYLVSGLLPEDPKESRKIRFKAPQYKLIRGSLYRRSFYTTWLRCVASPQTDNIIKEIHEGSCGFNAELRSMVVRITKQGYYWTSMHRDAAKVIQDSIIPTSENNVAKDDRGRIKKVDERRESKKVASIEVAYYRNKLCRHHNERSSHSTYKIGDFVLLSQNNTGSPQTWQGPHMISEVWEGGLYKTIDAFDHSLI
ncbi:reverse transcriptase domain-containing protein [Tanacetum coccineum]|uniref:Reverse transcriptase domain-containing protein n=1 Tax=Tanacetum coccineum TaxID=301880 RepID=A0ABQ5H4I0_9ASTR